MSQQRSDPAPCIINEGTLVNKRDVLRVLETLDAVDYSYAVEGDVMSSGQALVNQVFAGRETATLLVNNCLFLNVNSFEYVRFWQEAVEGAPDHTIIELHQGTTVLKLIPLPDEESESQQPLQRQMFPQPEFDEETLLVLDEDAEDDF